MDLGIAGKTAVVTGASSGIGAAVAEGLAAEGANVVVFARRADRLDELCERLVRDHGVDARAVAGDLSRREDIGRLAAAAAEMGGADILVINTGRPPTPMREILSETDEDRWERAYRDQLWGPVLLVQEIVPQIVAKGWGRVVAVTSASVKQPMTRHGLSTVFRTGVTGMLKHLANEIGRQGVTVNTVCPGSIATDRTGSVRNYDEGERIRQLPVGRLGRPEEFAAAVLFLVSARAGFITGASLPVDGGQVASLT